MLTANRLQANAVPHAIPDDTAIAGASLRDCGDRWRRLSIEVLRDLGLPERAIAVYLLNFNPTGAKNPSVGPPSRRIRSIPDPE